MRFGLMTPALVALGAIACSSDEQRFLRIPRGDDTRTVVIVWRGGVTPGGRVYEVEELTTLEGALLFDVEAGIEVQALLYDLPPQLLGLPVGSLMFDDAGASFPPAALQLVAQLDREEPVWIEQGVMETPLADMRVKPLYERSHVFDLSFVSYVTLEPLSGLEMCLSAPSFERCFVLPTGRLRARFEAGVRFTVRASPSGRQLGLALAGELHQDYEVVAPLLRMEDVDEVLSLAGARTIPGKGHIYFALTGESSAVRDTRALTTTSTPAISYYFNGDGYPDPNLTATSRKGTGMLLNLDPAEIDLRFDHSGTAVCSPTPVNWIHPTDARSLVLPILADHITLLGSVDCR